MMVVSPCENLFQKALRCGGNLPQTEGFLHVIMVLCKANQRYLELSSQEWSTSDDPFMSISRDENYCYSPILKIS